MVLDAAVGLRLVSQVHEARFAIARSWYARISLSTGIHSQARSRAAFSRIRRRLRFLGLDVSGDAHRD